jgi:hypothetical protein
LWLWGVTARGVDLEALPHLDPDGRHTATLASISAALQRLWSRTARDPRLVELTLQSEVLK